MIVCDTENIIELNNKSIKDLKFDDVVCYVFVGNNPGGNEGDVYIFNLAHNELRVYSGNVFDGGLDREHVYLLLKGSKDFFSEWNMTKCLDGWKGIPYVMGHYVFVKEFMVGTLQDCWKNIRCRYHFERLVKGVYETCKVFEKDLVDNNSIDEEDILIKIFEMYPDILKDTFRLRAAISDLMPCDVLHRNLICAAAEEQIPQKIMRKKGDISPKEIQGLIRELVLAYGCREALAEQVIHLWITVINEKKLSISDEDLEINNKPPMREVAGRTVLNDLIDVLKRNPMIWKEPKKIKEKIKVNESDYLLRNLVCVAVTERIPYDLYYSDNVDAIFLQSLINRLVSSYGCKENVAESAVLCWRDAFRYSLDKCYEKVDSIKIPYFYKNDELNYLQQYFYEDRNIYDVIGLLYCALFNFDYELDGRTVLRIADAGLAYISMIKQDGSLDGKMALLRTKFLGSFFCIVKGDLKSAARLYNDIIANSVLEYDRCLKETGRRDSEYISLYFMAMTNVFNLSAISGMNLYYLKKLTDYGEFFRYINPNIFSKEQLDKGYYSIAFPNYEQYKHPVYGNNFKGDEYQARMGYGMYGRLRIWRNSNNEKKIKLIITSNANPAIGNTKNNICIQLTVECEEYLGIPDNWNDNINSSRDMDFMVLATNRRHENNS